MSARAFRAAAAAMAVGFSACAADIHPTVSPAIAVSRMQEFWEMPAEIPAADLLNGPWGVEHAPDAGEHFFEAGYFLFQVFAPRIREAINPNRPILRGDSDFRLKPSYLQHPL